MLLIFGGARMLFWRASAVDGPTEFHLQPCVYARRRQETTAKRTVQCKTPDKDAVPQEKRRTCSVWGHCWRW